MTSTTRLLSLMLCGAIACAVSACVAKSDVTTCGVTGVLCGKGFHCAAAQGICIADAATLCGDLKKDDGEACDDGNNLDGDGCSADCKSDESCGNEKVDKPIPGNLKDPRNEDCEPPNKVDTTSGFFCKANCKFAFCGNGATDPEIGEICDDGNTKGGDGCAANCKSTELCGNGIKDQPFKDANGVPDLNDPRNEVCDDGNTKDGDGCSSDCRSQEDCGNGKIDPGEECDDGKQPDGTPNNADDKDCRSDCVINRCGDGRPNTSGLLHHEDCDVGPLQADHNRAAVPTEGASCNIDCTAPACGDNKVNHSFKPNGTDGEQCDDGPGLNTNDRDCTASCLLNTCGDDHTNVIGPHHREGCDDGNRVDTDNCTNACVARTCGDGIVQHDAGEECDLGTLNSDHGACLSNCLLATCGDGHLRTDVPNLEECDGTEGPQPCSNQCRQKTCGNGIIDPGEECDRGGANNDGGDCRTDCIINRCGDGYKNISGAHTEACELLATPVPHGDHSVSTVETATCNINCTVAACGDGVLNRHFQPMQKDHPTTPASTTEQCDDGARVSGDSCSQDCQFEGCGNGVVDPGEQCDPPNPALHCSPTCFNQTCGNGILDPGEECDNGGANANNADCRSDCVINRCGDGRVNDSTLHGHKEACDGGPLLADGNRNATPTNTDACNSNCTVATCGDQIVNHQHKVAPPLTLTEQCDPPGPGCSATCRLENCGNGVQDPGEQCDDGNGHDGDECENDCTLPRCGNGITDDDRDNPADDEQCDDENLSNADDCLNTCKTATCGDGFTRSSPAILANKEDCDGSPTVCTYGDVDCQVCNACHLEDGTPLVCGDGITQAPNETCDSHNASCGACSADCQNVTLQQAKGLIFAAAGKDLAAAAPTDKFTLSDGFGHSFTFEFTNTTPTVGNIAIPFNAVSLDNTLVATAIVNAITTARTSGLQIAAVRVGGVVDLTNDRSSSLGNGTALDPRLSEAVSTSNFAVIDMSGGKGGNCLLNDPCATNPDCVSNHCSAGQCVAP